MPLDFAINAVAFLLLVLAIQQSARLWVAVADYLLRRRMRRSRMYRPLPVVAWPDEPGHMQ